MACEPSSAERFAVDYCDVTWLGCLSYVLGLGSIPITQSNQWLYPFPADNIV